MAKSLNKVQLIGNLTADPELKYTPSGTAVTTFSIATNRAWTEKSGEKKEEVEYHRIVAWQKLAELISQYLSKGKKVYVEGRLATKQWEDKEGNKKQSTEIVINDVIFLDSRGDQTTAPVKVHTEEPIDTGDTASEARVRGEVKTPKEEEEVAADDIPF